MYLKKNTLSISDIFPFSHKAELICYIKFVILYNHVGAYKKNANLPSFFYIYITCIVSAYICTMFLMEKADICMLPKSTVLFA